jgi:hypothetical protein
MGAWGGWPGSLGRMGAWGGSESGAEGGMGLNGVWGGGWEPWVDPLTGGVFSRL